MEISDLKKKIKMAMESVKELDEPYKLETYKIILSKSLDSEIQEEDNTEKKKPQESKKQPKNKENLDENLEKLASLCKISSRELSDVLKIENGEITLKKRFTGTDAEQQISATQLILLGYEIGLEINEIDSRTLKGVLKKSNIPDRNRNLAQNLKTKKDLFNMSSVSSRVNTYSLTANKGRASAIGLLTKLARGEEND